MELLLEMKIMFAKILCCTTVMQHGDMNLN